MNEHTKTARMIAMLRKSWSMTGSINAGSSCLVAGDVSVGKSWLVTGVVSVGTETVKTAQALSKCKSYLPQ